MSALLQDFATRAAESKGDEIAIAMGEESLTYAELATASDRLAAQLADAGCERGDRVGLLVPKRPSAVVAMHAVLKAGAMYVPLDGESPPQRLARIIASAEPSLLLAVPEAAPRLDGLAETLALPPVWSVEAEPVEGDRVAGVRARGEWDVDGPAPDRRGREDDPAHLLFTSGSTGCRRAWSITHATSPRSSSGRCRDFGIRPTDRISGHPPLHFDLSTFDIYGTFAAGARAPPRAAGAQPDPRALADFIRDQALTQWFSVPSALTYMAQFDAVGHDDFPALERLLWCGEVLPTPVLPTGCGGCRTCASRTSTDRPRRRSRAATTPSPRSQPDESVPVPIGARATGRSCSCSTRSWSRCPPGEIGDLYIGGVGPQPGLLARPGEDAGGVPARSARAGSGARIYKTGDLARVDEDGLVHFLGRADSQIKSRGYRIELGEIESALNAIAGVRECAVVGVELDGFEGTAICAAYAGVAALEPPALRRALTAALPAYMLPARWLTLDALPKNQNGKIDRPALREQFASRNRAPERTT